MDSTPYKNTQNSGGGGNDVAYTPPPVVSDVATHTSSTNTSGTGQGTDSASANATDNIGQVGDQQNGGRLSSVDIFQSTADRKIGLAPSSSAAEMSAYGFPDVDIDFSGDDLPGITHNMPSRIGNEVGPLKLQGKDYESMDISGNDLPGITHNMPSRIGNEVGPLQLDKGYHREDFSSNDLPGLGNENETFVQRNMRNGALGFSGAELKGINIGMTSGIDDTTLISTSAAKNDGGENAGSGSAPESSSHKVEDKTVDQMLKYFQDNFDKLDTDKDGRIDRSELEARMLSKDVSLEEGIYLAAMHQKLDKWDGVHTPPNEDWHVINPSAITKDSLQAARDHLQQPLNQKEKDQLDVYKTLDDFKNIDSNNDECITEKELDEALKKDGWSPEQKERLQKLKEHFKEVAQASDDWRQEYTNVPSTHLHPRDSATSGLPGEESGENNEPPYVSFKDLEQYGDKENRLNVSLQNALNGRVDHANNTDVVEQSGTGSCFLMSSIAALQEQNPQAIKDMIHDNNDGTVTVTFPGDPSHPVTIDKPTAGERAMFSGNEDAGIIEKAFAEYAVKQPDPSKFLSHLPEGKPGMVQDLFNKTTGGFSKEALQLLTGHDVKETNTEKVSEDQLRKDLTEAAKNHDAIVGDTKVDQPPDTPVQPQHSYKVEYDPKTDKVYVTNPNKPDRNFAAEPSDLQGRPKDGKADGRFEMTVAEFQKYFGRIHCSSTK